MKRLLYPIVMAVFICNAGLAAADECEAPNEASKTETLILKRLCNVESELKAINKKLNALKPKTDVKALGGVYVLEEKCTACLANPYSPACIKCRQGAVADSFLVPQGGLNPCSNETGVALALCNEKLLQNFIKPLPSPFDPKVQPPQFNFSQ